MRALKTAALITFVATSTARAAVQYDTFLLPLTVSGETIQLPGASAPQSVSAGQAVGSGSGVSTQNDAHALVWSLATGTATDLNGIYPGPLTASNPLGSDGSQQVGSGSGSLTGANQHALLWSNTSSSVIDLNPTNLTGIAVSLAYGVSGNQQVGYGAASVTGTAHALLWTGSASSAVDLTPTKLGTFSGSYAEATDGTQQVGGVLYASNNPYDTHAILWSNTAASAVDLTPTDLPQFVNSYAYGVSGNQQVGMGYPAVSNDPFGGIPYHALLWTGLGGSAVDLNPTNLSGITISEALGTNGSMQVGVGGMTAAANSSHGIVWSGTAASAQDLQPFLPSSGSWTASIAKSIDASGNIYGTATGTFNGVTASFETEWVPTTLGAAVTVAAGEVYHFAGNAAASITARTLSGLTLNAGALAVLDPAANTATRQLLVINGSGLIFSGTTGRFDVGNNDLDLPTETLLTVRALLSQGFSAGGWNGSGGIVSASAAADASHLMAIGYLQNNQSGSALFTASHPFDGTTPGPGDVLLKYTYIGDANLDGKVDGSDYSLIDSGYLDKGSTWFTGDFNYDGIVNGSDYTLIDNAFNRQAAAISSEPSVPLASVTSQIVAGSPVNVPEPTSMMMLVLGCSLLLIYRSAAWRLQSP